MALTWKGWVNEHRTICIFPADGLLAAARIRSVRTALSGRIAGLGFRVFRSIPVPGFRAADVEPSFVRDWNLSAGGPAEALSRGVPVRNFAQHLGRRQRTKRLAPLCRHGPDLDSHGLIRMCPWRLWHRARVNGLSPWFHHRLFSVCRCFPEPISAATRP